MVDAIGHMMGNYVVVNDNPDRLPGPDFDELHPEAKLAAIVAAINTQRDISWKMGRWLLEQAARHEAEVIRLLELIARPSNPYPEPGRAEVEVVEQVAGAHNARHGVPNKGKG